MARPAQDCVVLFGDSLTESMFGEGTLAKRMNDVYARKLDVLNRGFGGYNTEMALSVFDGIFATKDMAVTSQEVRLVTLWWGTNDSVHPPNTRHLPLPAFVSNLETLLDRLISPSLSYAVAHGDHPFSIILITPPPLCPTWDPGYQPDRPRVRSKDRQNEFREAVLKIGNEYIRKQSENPGVRWKLAVVDLWGAIVKVAGGDGAELDPYFVDDVHLNSEGYAVLWREIEQTMKQDFTGRGIDWTDIDDLPMAAPCARCGLTRCRSR